MQGGGRRRSAGALFASVGLAVAFLAVHAWLYAADVLDVPLNASGSVTGVSLNAYGDVTGAYRGWVDQWHATGQLVGIDRPWVYPVVAILPMLVAGLFGDADYLRVWVLLAIVLNAGATVLLARRRMDLAWYFVAFILLLGPITLVRIDAIALPIAIAGVLAVHERPAVAAVLFTIGAWVKVWPAMLLIALVVASRRTAAVIIGAALTCVAVIGVAVAFGARSAIFSFITAQTDRGLQIEAPVTAPWLWLVAAGRAGSKIYYSSLLTFQVTGPGVHAASEVMTPVLIVGVAAVVLLGLLARRRGVLPDEVLALTALGLVSAVIALNKVGSPQYATWYAAPVLLGMLAAPRHFRFPAMLVAVLALMTQIVYPWFYDLILHADPAMLVVLDLRNLLELVLLGWTIEKLATVRPAAAEVLQRTGFARARAV